MSKQSVTTVAKVDNTFELTLPPELEAPDVAPAFTVPVSRNYTAYVYRMPTNRYVHVQHSGGSQVYTKDGEPLFVEKVDVIQWGVSVRHNRTGQRPRETNASSYSRNTGYTYVAVFETLIEVRECIISVAASLRPKATTMREEVNDDM